MTGAVNKPGIRLRSAISEAEVVVVRPVSGETVLTCGGVPMVGVEEVPTADAGQGNAAEPVQLGKRYFDEATGLEVLCSKGGDGPLAIDGRALELRGAKALPSSD